MTKSRVKPYGCCRSCKKRKELDQFDLSASGNRCKVCKACAKIKQETEGSKKCRRCCLVKYMSDFPKETAKANLCYPCTAEQQQELAELEAKNPEAIHKETPADFITREDAAQALINDGFVHQADDRFVRKTDRRIGFISRIKSGGYHISYSTPPTQERFASRARNHGECWV